MNAFDSLKLGPVELNNRLFMAPVKTAFAGTDAQVTDRLIRYYRRRAQGGVGTIIVEPMFVDAAGKEHPKQLGIADDGAIDGLRQLVDAIHKEGARAIAHINHAGRAANPKASGVPPLAPSAIACPTTGATPEVISSKRIETVIAAFTQAAGRAREAGFDGVEVQCGLGYLVAQFLSEKTNQRNDEWGGSAENRIRFMERVMTGVRKAIGGDLALMARISGTEKVDGGIDIEDAIHIGTRLAELGVDAVHVASGSACDTPPWYYQHMGLPAGVNLKLAERLRQNLTVPVIAAGRLGDPEEIEQIFRDGAVDAIALGRPLVADPDLPIKIRTSQSELVVRCGGCLQGCLVGVKSGKGIACIVNPEVGKEDMEYPATTGEKEVVVVGGGPAGMTAARVAAARGHRVTLLERSADVLGGQFAHAYQAPGKAAMRQTLDSFVRLTRSGNMDIRMGTEAGIDDIVQLRPDIVFVATGAEPIIPPIPGLSSAITGEEIMSGNMSVGHKVLVIGGGLIGIEVAEYLAERQHQVVVVEMLDQMAQDMEPITRKLSFLRLQNLPVALYTGTKITQITEGEAIAQGPDGEVNLGKFDSIVVATGTRPLDVLSQGLREQGLEVHVVGDAAQIGQVQGATTSAYEIASRL